MSKMVRDAQTRGFTLLELILLLAIIALVSAIAAPQLSGFARARDLPATAAQFMEAARWARTSAISDGVPYRLNINVAGEQWYVTKGDGTVAADGITPNFAQAVGPFAEAHSIQPANVRTEADKITVTTNLSAVDGVVFITFEPTGWSDVATFTFQRGNSTVVVKNDTPMGSYYIVGGP